MIEVKERIVESLQLLRCAKSLAQLARFSFGMVVFSLPVPTENSIALKKRDQHAIGKKFLGLAKALAAVPRLGKEMQPPLLGAGAEEHPSLPTLRRSDAGLAHAARRSYR